MFPTDCLCLQPYKSAKTDRVAVISEANLFVTLLCLLMMKMNLSGEALDQAVYDNVLFWFNVIAAILPLAWGLVDSLRRLATEWTDSKHQALQKGSWVRIIDCANPRYRGCIGQVLQDSGDDAQATDDGLPYDRDSERCTVQIRVPPWDSKRGFLGLQENAATKIQAAYRGRAARHQKKADEELRKMKQMQFRRGRSNRDLGGSGRELKPTKTKTKFSRKHTLAMIAVNQFQTTQQVEKICGKEVRLVTLGTKTRPLQRNDVQRLFGRKDAALLLKALFDCVRLCRVGVEQAQEEQHSQSLTGETEPGKSAPYNQPSELGPITEDDADSDTEVISTEQAVMQMGLAKLRQRLKAKGVAWDDDHPAVKLLNDPGQLEQALEDPEAFIAKILAASGPRAMRPLLEPKLAAHNLSWDENALPAIELLTGPELDLMQIINDPDAFVQQLLSVSRSAGKKIALAKLRPVLEPKLTERGLAWEDATHVLELIDSIDEIERAVECPDAFLDGLVATAGPIGMRMALARLRPKVEPLLNSDGVAWKDALPAIELLADMDYLQQAVEHPDVFVQQLLSVSGSAGKKIALAKLRPVLEPKLTERGLAWEDATHVLELIDSIDEIERAVECPDAFLDGLVATAGPIGMRMALARLRPKVEPLLNSDGVAWKDALPAMELEYLSLLQVANDPDEFVQQLLSVSGSAGKKIAVARIRSTLEPKLTERGLAWEDVTPVLELIDSIDQIERAFVSPDRFLDSLMSAAGPIAMSDDMRIGMTLARLRPKMEPLLAARGVAWDDALPVTDMVYSLQDLEEAIDSPDAFVQKFMQLSGAGGKRIAIAQLRLQLEPLLHRSFATTWAVAREVFETTASEDDLQAAASDPVTFLRSLLGNECSLPEEVPGANTNTESDVRAHVLIPVPPNIGAASTGQGRPVPETTNAALYVMEMPTEDAAAKGVAVADAAAAAQLLEDTKAAHEQALADKAAIERELTAANHALAKADADMQAMKDAAAAAAAEAARLLTETQNALEEARAMQQQQRAEFDFVEQSRLMAEEDRLEQERVAAEEAEQDRIVQAEQDRLADLAEQEQQQAEQERMAAERAEQERVQAEERRREEEERQRQALRAAEDRAVQLVEASLNAAKADAAAGNYDDAIARFERGLVEVADPNVPGVWVAELKPDLEACLAAAHAKAEQAKVDANRSLVAASASASVQEAKDEIRKLMQG